MFQRIQTIFLVLAAAAMLIASSTPLATFNYNYSEEVVFESMGIYLNGTLNDSTWGLFAISIGSSVLALITIFLYKKRMLQIRLSIFNLVLMIGFYLFFGFIFYKVYSVEELLFNKIGRSEERRVGKECRSWWSAYH